LKPLKVNRTFVNAQLWHSVQTEATQIVLGVAWAHSLRAGYAEYERKGRLINTEAATNLDNSKYDYPRGDNVRGRTKGARMQYADGDNTERD
jgi:hypothetical protein